MSVAVVEIEPIDVYNYPLRRLGHESCPCP